MEVYRYKGVDYSTLPEMETAVGKKSSLKKFQENDLWVNEYVDYTMDHLNYMQQLEIKMQLEVKKARYDYICKELLFEDNQDYRDEALQLRIDIPQLESQIGAD